MNAWTAPDKIVRFAEIVLYELDIMPIPYEKPPAGVDKRLGIYAGMESILFAGGQPSIFSREVYSFSSAAVAPFSYLA